MAFLRCEQLSYQYADQTVLQPTTLEFKAGQCVGLIGANGAGKSTLLQLLMGLKPPHAGRVQLQDEDIARCSRETIGRALSYVPQYSPDDVGLSVTDVVAMGRYVHQPRWLGVNPADQAVISLALQQTDLTALAARPLHALSGGERQRVFIARALAQQAAMLLLDEPTASLDLNHQLEVMQLLSEFVTRGGGVVIALHDLNLAARFCQRLVLLSAGQVVADGSPAEVLTPDNLASYFQVHAEVTVEASTGGLRINPLAPVAEDYSSRN
ncbi:ABC transporter ATP-binding protein [Pontibacter sp. JAM-7]|uniref:ABC transporter ATP-binding protein n=1 Tax=Pontibacter sp. JAM-7 TaxID=3366581 RepID=UPI003AF44AD8